MLLWINFREVHDRRHSLLLLPSGSGPNRLSELRQERSTLASIADESAEIVMSSTDPGDRQSPSDELSSTRGVKEPAASIKINEMPARVSFGHRATIQLSAHVRSPRRLSGSALKTEALATNTGEQAEGNRGNKSLRSDPLGGEAIEMHRD